MTSEKIIDVSVDTVYQPANAMDWESKSELFDRLVKEVLIDHPLGKCLLQESIDRVMEENANHPDDPLPMYSSIMITFKRILLMAEAYVMEKGSTDDMD